MSYFTLISFSVTFSEEGKYKILFRKLNTVLSRYEALVVIYFRLPWDGGRGLVKATIR